MKIDKNRIRGLDSIRFVSAMWVVFSHLGFFPLFHSHDVDGNNVSGIVFRGIWGNMFAGPPAVVVFFLISGFCIHYPFRNDESIPLLKYWIRRYLRIGIPALAGMLIIHYLAPANAAFNLYATNNTVVWSLVAEAVYYGLYPALFSMNRRYGWTVILGCSSLLAFIVMISNPKASYFPSYGPWLTWIIGFPSWLLGCKLAHSADGDRNLLVGARQLWCWRLSVWFLSSAASVMRFHTSIGYPWTLNIFAISCFFWLRREVAYFRKHPPPSYLEWAGKWSYSIYIVHLVVPDVLMMFKFPHWGMMANWLVTIIAVLPASYLFYLVVEAPSHWFARAIASYLKRANKESKYPAQLPRLNSETLDSLWKISPPP